MRKLLKTGLILLPIFCIPITVNFYKINIRDARELLFESLAIIGIGIAIGNKWIRCFLTWAVINWWFNYFLPPQSTVILFNISLAMLLFYFIKTYIKEIDIDSIIKIICITAIFQVVWLGVQYIGWDFIFHPIDANGIRQAPHIKDRLVGFLGNKNILGCYLAICLPLFRVKFKKLLPLIIIGLFVARASMALIAGFTGLLFYEIFITYQSKDIRKFNTMIKVIGSCIIIAIIFFIFIDRPNFDRIAIWKQTITHQVNWKCIIGQGLGKFQNLKVLDKYGIWWDNPHNEYLQIYFELGIIGLTLLLGYFITLFKRFLKHIIPLTILLMSCIIVILVNSLGMFPFQIAPTAFLAITFIALLEGVLCRHHKKVSLKS